MNDESRKSDSSTYGNIWTSDGRLTLHVDYFNGDSLMQGIASRQAGLGLVPNPGRSWSGT